MSDREILFIAAIATALFFEHLWHRKAGAIFRIKKDEWRQNFYIALGTGLFSAVCGSLVAFSDRGRSDLNESLGTDLSSIQIVAGWFVFGIALSAIVWFLCADESSDCDC